MHMNVRNTYRVCIENHVIVKFHCPGDGLAKAVRTGKSKVLETAENPTLVGSGKAANFPFGREGAPWDMGLMIVNGSSRSDSSRRCAEDHG